MQLEDLRLQVRAIMDAHVTAERAAQRSYEAALDALSYDPEFITLNVAQPDLVGAVFRSEMNRMLAEVDPK